MSAFVLDSRLQHDTAFVKDLTLCRLLLMKNASFPWVVLVPRQPGAVELIDLSVQDRHQLMDEISDISEQMQQLFSPDKLNVATLGNQVSQLHIHIIARYKNDSAWPNPVWGSKSTAYTQEALEGVLGKLR